MKNENQDLQAVVERITREIVGQMGSAKHAAPKPANPPAQAARQILVVFSGTDGQDRETLAQLSQLGQGMTLTLVVPRWGQGLFSSLGQAHPEWKILAADGERIDPQELLMHQDLVVIPDLPERTAHQLASFQGFQYPANLILGALRHNTPVVAVAGHVRRNGDRTGLVEDLQQLGVVIVETKELAAACGAALRSLPGNTASKKPCAGCTTACQNCGHGLCIQQAPQRVDAVVNAGATRISCSIGVSSFRRDLASVIDHTLLKAEATEQEVTQLCAEARQYGFASVCINPTWVSLSAKLLQGSGVRVCTVIGFPLGATSAAAKAAETRDAIANGAEEVDMVLNIGALKSGQYRQVEEDIRGVVEASRGHISKVILETCLLTDEEKIMACQLAKAAGATFVKTSTGFSKGGATVDDIALMRRVVGPEMGVKASGGVRDCATAEQMVKAGATRIGASASVAIAQCEPTAAKKGDGY